MKVLLVGSGAREHALAWALAKSPLVTTLCCAPGNAGIAAVAERVDIAAMDLDGLVDFARARQIDFVVIGPEAPLVAGLADRLEAAGIKALGPSAAGAALEGSKGFVKDLCAENDIPTAAYGRFSDAASAKAYAAKQTVPIVIKADGLAAGKGVIIAETREAVDAAIDSMFDGAFGDAGHEVVIEEFLEGEEASLFVLSDGENALLLAGAQDHKRAYDGDEGPNTGGMGAYSPAPVLTDAIIEATMARIIRPTIAALAARGTPYQGVLYAGLMIGEDGPKLIEYNCRFGDPECQVLMMRLESDLCAVLLAAREGTLDQVHLKWRDAVALTVVMAAKGYPGSYEKGSEIRGLDEAAQLPDVEVFHAATEGQDGKLVATGGRVLSVTALGASVAEAQARAYEAIGRIDWPGGFYRHDIGWRAIAREH